VRKQKNIKKLISTMLVVSMFALLALGVVGCADDAGAANGGSTANTDPIVFVWYPNESSAIYTDARNEFGRIIYEATGRPVEHMLTTDYVIAIEAIAGGQADLATMGPVGYIMARERNPAVNILVVSSGSSGTLDDAVYFGWLAVNRDIEDEFRDGDGWCIQNIQGRSMSFVSAASTSGFVVPVGAIIEEFSDSWPGIDEDVILDAGPNGFFSQQIFGVSHQGAMFNLLDGRVEVATFCDTCVQAYVELVYGEENATGSIYALRQGVEAPFTGMDGMEFRIIRSIAVPNFPIAYNSDNFTPEEIAAILEALLSDSTTMNPLIFTPDPDVYRATFRRTRYERFIDVDDSFYDVMR